ncbi:MAG: PilZ domain-containing protein, partial [Chlorobiales bacterium]|nr:PilZ domain-containing protein [Chlorobiales bacterium]
MVDNRHNKRLDCEECCHLRLRDSFYSAMIKNISLGGALVHFYDSQPGARVG